METRDPAAGHQETLEGGVVLRFPGDWVGPLEELVPFGPSADREPPPGSDFWGEDSAVLQDAVEAPERPPVSPVRPPLVRRWLLAAGAVLAAVLFGVAAVLGTSPSTAPHVHGVTFGIASIPPLAPAAPAATKRPRRHHAATRPRTHRKPTRPTESSTPARATSSPATTPSPTYHPAPARASAGSAGSTSQSGGAFTLGGP